MPNLEPDPEILKVKIEKSEATLPVRASEGAAGYDLFAVEDTVVFPQEQALVGTSISIEIPKDHYGQIKPRSGLVLRKSIMTDARVIDRDFRGEVKVVLVNQGKKKFIVKKGEWIAQLILV